MKNTQKITRLKLNIGEDTDYTLLGIVSSEPDYKLSLSLNKKFSITLKNISPLRIPGDNNTELTFSMFSNNEDPAGLFFNLVSNRSGKYFLISKLKNIDYLLQLQIPEKEAKLSRIVTDIREIETVTAVFNIDTSTLKDKNLHYLKQ
jgi:hypothetical protein